MRKAALALIATVGMTVGAFTTPANAATSIGGPIGGIVAGAVTGAAKGGAKQLDTTGTSGGPTAAQNQQPSPVPTSPTRDGGFSTSLPATAACSDISGPNSLTPAA